MICLGRMVSELKKVVEAILFAAARRIELSELAKLAKSSQEEVLSVLQEWRSEIENSQSSVMLVEDGSFWKLTVRQKYVPVVKKVLTQSEMPKSIVETLAVVAYKAP